MIATDLRSGVEQLGDMIAEASTIVPFTGAGISTECGIPDFRSPGGFWTRHKPIQYRDFIASDETRIEAWTRFFGISEQDLENETFDFKNKYQTWDLLVGAAYRF